MSKLDEAIDRYTRHVMCDEYHGMQDDNSDGHIQFTEGKFKQQIKDFFRELIGEDEKYIPPTPNYNWIGANDTIDLQNAWRADLREKVEEL